MGRAESESTAALDRAHTQALAWLSSLDERPVPAQASVEEMIAALGPGLPTGSTSAEEVIALLGDAAPPGLVAMPSGRFFGFVIGGTHPAGLAADWLVSAWDQNSALYAVTPTHSALERITKDWLLDLLGLPGSADVGFVTGGTMANFTCLAAARDALLRQAGWDVAQHGLAGAPRVRVIAGAERHDTIDLSLRMLGLGAPDLVSVDEQGRLRVDALREALEGASGPVCVCLQAGNIHSGACDPMTEAIVVAHEAGAWVHVDGAFGLWAAASERTRHLVAGMEAADSWSTDAHKTLNVPYDCGIAIVAAPAALHAAMGMHGDYLIADDQARDPLETVPELSRRGRVVPVWAVLRTLGRSGVAELVDRLCGHARAFEVQIAEIPGCTVLNEVVFTQVSLALQDDAATSRAVERIMADGECWMTGSRWRDRAVVRISVSNWSTTEDDVRRSVAALRRASAPFQT
ncbi:pyridoxal phosphate-dependent decarboxylase family protein [Ornithinimicrobium cryptoxanthini]|uniref:pyridoxal phosphate-dependent decarboxylase family protein n=1 Tax=Ornithinimicrobium cryptoxanthini TaxID=2934161 RepID=UPI002117AF75|nr:aminotransferase class V-fold PLP-dependent enzyme [Ornithinimicrobium cryptoxanthini]